MTESDRVKSSVTAHRVLTYNSLRRKVTEWGKIANFSGIKQTDELSSFLKIEGEERGKGRKPFTIYRTIFVQLDRQAVMSYKW